MIKFHEQVASARQIHFTLLLPFELRQKSRLRVTLDDGCEAGLFLPRGVVLRDGDLLRGDTGQVVRIKAAAECVSTVAASAGGPRQLLLAAYHLGNRHVALQIGDGWLRYLHDHVLDEMVGHFGLQVSVEQQPFEPESGAYHGSHHHQHGA